MTTIILLFDINESNFSIDHPAPDNIFNSFSTFDSEPEIIL